jgi:ribosome biogenesis GTPase
MNLEDFGWTPNFARACESAGLTHHRSGRVFLASRDIFSLYTESGEIETELSGRFRYSGKEWPVVGDWVLFRDRLIDAVLPRRTRFSRKQPGAKTAEQVIAANVDVVFLVAGLDRDFNLRRLERSLVLAYESGAAPAVVLNKADLCADVAGAVLAAETVAPGVPVFVTSGAAHAGLAQISSLMHPGQTAVLIGSSGVGKSTLINALIGHQRQHVHEVRAGDNRGRHTTTHRELILLPEGWLIMDLPGLRELQLWTDEAGVGRAFSEIEEFAAACRFRDCRHEGEPGCAVTRALADGILDPTRFRNFTKMRREAEHLAREQDTLARLEQKRQWKRIHQGMKKNKKWGGL